LRQTLPGGEPASSAQRSKRGVRNRGRRLHPRICRRVTK